MSKKKKRKLTKQERVERERRNRHKAEKARVVMPEEEREMLVLDRTVKKWNFKPATGWEVISRLMNKPQMNCAFTFAVIANEFKQSYVTTPTMFYPLDRVKLGFDTMIDFQVTEDKFNYIKGFTMVTDKGNETVRMAMQINQIAIFPFIHNGMFYIKHQPNGQMDILCQHIMNMQDVPGCPEDWEEEMIQDCEFNNKCKGLQNMMDNLN